MMSELRYEYEWLKNLTKDAKVDPVYQYLLVELRRSEQAFVAVMDTLSESQQQAIEKYFVDCDELDYRLMFLSYELGRIDETSSSGVNIDDMDVKI